MSKTHIIRPAHIGSVLKMAQHSSLLQQINFSELDHSMQIFINTSENHRAGGCRATLLDRIILVRKDAGLPNHKWWEELFEFRPTFIAWKILIF